MKKGIYYSSLPVEMDWPDKFRIAKEAGFDGVEISTVYHSKQLKEIKAASQETNIIIPSVMDSKHWKCPQSSPDDKIRSEGLDNLKISLETASELGADTVLLVPGVVSEDTPYDEAYYYSLRSMEKVKHLAESYKINVGLENVWNKFLLSPIEFKDFIDKVESPYVGAYFDVGNVILYGYPEQWITILGNRIKKIHVKNFLRSNYTFTHLLYGDVKWTNVMQALRKINYDDFLTAELPAYHFFKDRMLFDTAGHLSSIISI